MWHYQLLKTKPLTKGTDSSINNISGDTYITNNDTDSLFVVKNSSRSTDNWRNNKKILIVIGEIIVLVRNNKRNIETI